MDVQQHINFPEDVELAPGRSLDGRVILDPRFTYYVHTGGFSDIWRGKLKMPGGEIVDVALKIFRGAHTDATVLATTTKRIYRESHVWLPLSHPNVLPFYGVCSDLLPSPALVSPYSFHGTALKFLRNHGNANRMRIVTDVADGLSYLHESRVIHGDLKTTNVLIDPQGRAMICDFGCSKIIGFTGFTTDAHYHRFTAPELIMSSESNQPKLSKEADVYSFAMVVLELLTDKAPFYHLPDCQIPIVLFQNHRPIRDRHNPWHITPALVDWIWKMLEACWQKDPMARPTMNVVCQKVSRASRQPIRDNLGFQLTLNTVSRDLSLLEQQQDATLSKTRPSTMSDNLLSIQNHWLRDPNGRSLPQPPPNGMRTPNGIIWGHSLNDFYWIQRHPGVNVFTVWSRSMLREFGENFTGEDHDHEPSPRVLRPWPVLQLPPGVSSDPPLGLVDETCFCHHIRVPLSVDLYDDDGNLRPAAPLSSEVPDNSAHAPNGTTAAGGVENSQVVTKSTGSEMKAEAVDNASSMASLPTTGDDVQPASILPVEDLMAVLGGGSGTDTKQQFANKIPPGDLLSKTAENINASATNDALPVQAEESTSVVDKPTNDSDGGNRGDTNHVTQDDRENTVVDPKAGNICVTPDSGVGGDKPESTQVPEANPVDEAKDPSEGSFVAADTNQTASDCPGSAVREARQVESRNTSGIATVGTPGEKLELAQIQAANTVGESKDCLDGNDGSTVITYPSQPVSDAPERTVSGHKVDTIEDEVITNADVSGDRLVTQESQGSNRVNESNDRTDSGYGVSIAIDVKQVAANGIEGTSSSGNDVASNPLVLAQSEGSKSAETTKSVPDSPENPGIDAKAKATENTSAITDDKTADSTSKPAESKDGSDDRTSDATDTNKDIDIAGDRSNTQESKKPDYTPETSLSKVCWESISKLEEFIPEEYFPDILLVNDPCLATSGRRFHGSYEFTAPRNKPYKYKRVWPELDGPSNRPPQIAHLNLYSTKLLGEGHHSYVYRAALRLPEPLSARSPTGEVTVAAKIAMPYRGSYEGRELLKNEGKIYNAFPKHLMEDWCGLNLLPPLRNPVPVCAVVPKFYGYYVHDKDDVNHEDNPDPSPILLVEECGEQLQTSRFSFQERLKIYSSLLRLHHAGFLQESLYIRNILVQPGPLTKPPSQRSIKTPSFRFIDFGRAMSWATRSKEVWDKYDLQSARDIPKEKRFPLISQGTEWYGHLDYEVDKAHSGAILYRPLF